MAKGYFYIIHDEYSVYFETEERLLEFLRSNTSKDEVCEVGYDSSLTDAQFAAISDKDA